MIDVTPHSRKHAVEITAFRRKLLSDETDSTEWVSSGDASKMPDLRPLGPLKSVTDRHAELTIGGDVTDQSALLEDDKRAGMVVTMSVAAHHRQLRSRLRLRADEAAAWIAEIIGDEWAASAYTAGALSTTGNSHSTLTTQFFYVFVGPDGRPQVAPDEFNLPLRRLSEVR